MRSQVARAEHAIPPSAKLLHGAPSSHIVLGLHQMEGIVAAEKRRIVYKRAHPGVFPAQ